jgi:hypothetical protein
VGEPGPVLGVRRFPFGVGGEGDAAPVLALAGLDPGGREVELGSFGPCFVVV